MRGKLRSWSDIGVLVFAEGEVSCYRGRYWTGQISGAEERSGSEGDGYFGG